MKQGIYYNNTDWTHKEVCEFQLLYNIALFFSLFSLLLVSPMKQGIYYNNTNWTHKEVCEFQLLYNIPCWRAGAREL